jgi:hypothetical protein
MVVSGNPHHRRWVERFGLSSALHRGAVTGAPCRPKMPSPGVILLGPFDTTSSPVPPVTPRWLLTPARMQGSSKMFCTGAVPHR